MYKRLEEFTARELVERRTIQELLHTALLELKKALDIRAYNEALFLNITSARLLNILISNNLALEDEAEMLEVLRGNASNILKLQNRLQ
ncbi:MAG: hypothetical protein RML40_06160 [Bacteroidota bacterium]|nr:hypothetical protein [Candidatus Kapabacteria bacterium]MDW8220098.1 hypothetical protein [Bacteroidota bacterium]